MTKGYIGDGVYVEFDGYGIWLYANDFNNPTNKIYLEPMVLEALIRFSLRMKEPHKFHPKLKTLITENVK